MGLMPVGNAVARLGPCEGGLGGLGGAREGGRREREGREKGERREIEGREKGGLRGADGLIVMREKDMRVRTRDRIWAAGANGRWQGVPGVCRRRPARVWCGVCDDFGVVRTCHMSQADHVAHQWRVLSSSTVRGRCGDGSVSGWGQDSSSEPCRGQVSERSRQGGNSLKKQRVLPLEKGGRSPQIWQWKSVKKLADITGL